MTKGVRIKSHYPEAKKAIQKKLVPRMLATVLLYIEQQAKLILTDNGRVDTGFLRNSAYLMGLGLDNGERLPESGKFPTKKKPGHGHRVRAQPQTPSEPSNSVVLGFAAAYAFWIEQKCAFVMKALQRAKDKYGGHAKIEVKE